MQEWSFGVGFQSLLFWWDFETALYVAFLRFCRTLSVAKYDFFPFPLFFKKKYYMEKQRRLSKETLYKDEYKHFNINFKNRTLLYITLLLYVLKIRIYSEKASYSSKLFGNIFLNRWFIVVVIILKNFQKFWHSWEFKIIHKFRY